MGKGDVHGGGSSIGFSKDRELSPHLCHDQGRHPSPIFLHPIKMRFLTPDSGRARTQPIKYYSKETSWRL